MKSELRAAHRIYQGRATRQNDPIAKKHAAIALWLLPKARSRRLQVSPPLALSLERLTQETLQKTRTRVFRVAGPSIPRLTSDATLPGPGTRSRLRPVPERWKH